MAIQISQLPLASSVSEHTDYFAVCDEQKRMLKRISIQHASESTAFGVGSATEYGHTKVVDNLGQSEPAQGEVLAARQGNILANDIGPVELSSIATYPHSIGDYFIFIGQFVKCKMNIQVGETIAYNTNVIATSIGEILREINDKNANQDTEIAGLGERIVELTEIVDEAATKAELEHAVAPLEEADNEIRLNADKILWDTSQVVNSSGQKDITYEMITRFVLYDHQVPMGGDIPQGTNYWLVTGTGSIYKTVREGSSYTRTKLSPAATRINSASTIVSAINNSPSSAQLNASKIKTGTFAPSSGNTSINMNNGKFHLGGSASSNGYIDWDNYEAGELKIRASFDMASDLTYINVPVVGENVSSSISYSPADLRSYGGVVYNFPAFMLVHAIFQTRGEHLENSILHGFPYNGMQSYHFKIPCSTPTKPGLAYFYDGSLILDTDGLQDGTYYLTITIPKF